MRNSHETFDWVAYVRQDELSEEEIARAGEHLRSCQACQCEVDSLRRLQEQLAAYSAPDLPANFIAETTRLLDSGNSRTAGWKRWGLAGRFSWLRFRLLERPGLIAATMVVTLLVQWTIWNPFPGPTQIRTVFAIGGTVSPPSQHLKGLNLEAHPEGRFSSNLFQGRKTPQEIVKALWNLGLQFDVVNLWAPEGREVLVDLDEFSLLMDAFEVNTINMTGGVRGLLNGESSEDSGDDGLGDLEDELIRLGEWLRGPEAAAEPDPPILEEPGQVVLAVQGDRIVLDRAVLSPEQLEPVLRQMFEFYPHLELVLLEDSNVQNREEQLTWRRRLDQLGIPFSIIPFKK